MILLRSAGKPAGATSVGASCHVGDDGADMRLRPKRPFQVDRRAGGGSGVKRRGLRATDSASSVAVALDVDRGHVFNRSVAWDRAGNSLRLHRLKT